MDLEPGGGGYSVLPIAAYKGRFRPEWISYLGFSYLKGYGFPQLKYVKRFSKKAQKG